MQTPTQLPLFDPGSAEHRADVAALGQAELSLARLIAAALDHDAAILTAQADPTTAGAIMTTWATLAQTIHQIAR